MFARSMRWIEESGERPLFLFFNTYHAHAPYRAEEPFYSEWTGDRSQKQIDLVAPAEDPSRGALLRSKGHTIREGGSSEALGVGQGELARTYYESGIATVDRELRFARSWLYARLQERGAE